MKNKYIYIDESGDVGYTKKSTRYFILTAIMTDDPIMLRRIAKKVHKSKMDKNKSNILHSYIESNRIRFKLIDSIKNIDIYCVGFILDKTKIYQKDVYMYLLEKVAMYFSKLSINQITLARRETRGDYNKRIINMFNFYNIKLIISTPKDEKSLQIADFYSWSIFSYIEYQNSDYFKYINSHTIFR